MTASKLNLIKNPQQQHHARRVAVCRHAQKMGIGALLVTTPVNIFYLSGFSGSNGVLALCANAEATLVTDRRYELHARQETTADHVLLERDALAQAAQVAGNLAAAAAHGSQVGFEAEHLTVAQFQQLRGAVSPELLSPTTGIVAEVRRHKDPEEIDTIARACQIAEAALAEVVSDIRIGDQEVQIARQLEFAMLRLGADDKAFATIVAAGAHSAVPHHVPTAAPVQTGDLLKIDFGAKLGHYHSDITRTFVVGRDPDTEQLAIHAAVADAAERARAVVRAGLPAEVPYRVARESLDAVGWAQNFTHGLGHGVGLEIHEAPIMTAVTTSRLVTGDVITVEPGAYFPGRGGVRIEDTLVVTESGARALSSYPRALARVG